MKKDNFVMFWKVKVVHSPNPIKIYFGFSEYKECFSLYDRDGDGLISNEQLKLVMRSLEQCPTQMDMNQISSKLGIYAL